ncbi:RNA polymerase sigma-70 factor, ECF subfamily [Duganella sp. CF402]|uniref:sigma-70 family RNA polymerase sigma factor n=1 Tax=unclassified Duganella TaxID=2636909 RepID=UPI0008B97B51|nr:MULTISPECIES: sigma-70 family RNA polymerase sigma factor [unclassified Duganella]RZT10392.1 RNA polymerase sigma-70 factor (ECF subfamily) [Duganella sp. BK701]SEL15073.1 RNA polymerase sigma-70 factor, ECF subfamily [Duganella sp. CF402]
MTSAVPHPHFTALYSKHHSWLHRWLCAKLGNTHDADDLAQDTFTRILGRSDLTVLVEPRAYLTTVAKGVLVNWFQRQSLERVYLEALAALPEPTAISPEQRMVILETLHDIDAMLDTLPPKVRQAFLLSQLDGMGYAEIATRLDLSLITIKRYMKQAFLQCLLAMEDAV